MRKLNISLLMLLCIATSVATAQNCHTSGKYIESVVLMDNGNILRLGTTRLQPNVFEYAYFDLNSGTLVKTAKSNLFDGKGGYTDDDDRYGPESTRNKIDVYRSSYSYGCTLSLWENGKKTEQYFADCSDIYPSYDFKNRQGIIRFVPPMGKGKEKIYLYRPGQELKLIKKIPLGSAYSYFNFSPDGKYALSPLGALIDMADGKVLTEKFAPGLGVSMWREVYNEGSAETVRFSADSKEVALPMGLSGIEVRSVPDGRLLHTYTLPPSISTEDGNKPIPTPALDGFVFVKDPIHIEKKIFFEQDAWLIRNGEAILLCNPQADSVAIVLARQEAMIKPTTTGSSTVKKADVAEEKYLQLLDYLKNTDKEFEPYAKKILDAGTSSWVLYKTRSRAHEILRKQILAITDFQDEYGRYMSDRINESIETRLEQVRAAKANIPAN